MKTKDEAIEKIEVIISELNFYLAENKKGSGISFLSRELKKLIKEIYEEIEKILDFLFLFCYNYNIK